MTNRLILLGALLVPSVALAQPASDPNVPPPPPDAQPLPPPPGQPVTTQAPTVIVNPPAPVPPVTVEEPPPPVTTTVVTPEPEYEVVEDSYNAPIFFTGALVFGASYGASVITAASSDDTRGNHRLYVPLAGPWLALSDRGPCDIALSRCDNETTAKVLLIADGVFQAAGVLGMLDGIFQPSTHRVVTRRAKLDTKIHVTPSTVHGDPGVAVFGRF
ncbi:MAG TPA: hypothetical protein VIX73_20675 [Kofleriaceae bacterium]|jgi:hypothetical protein